MINICLTDSHIRGKFKVLNYFGLCVRWMQRYLICSCTFIEDIPFTITAEMSIFPNISIHIYIFAFTAPYCFFVNFKMPFFSKTLFLKY